MWEQDIQMQELGEEVKDNPEKKLKPLFTNGSGQKRTQGKSLWNLEGIKFYHRVGKKWRQVHDNKKNMRVLYNGWERWITTMGADIKIGDGLKKTFQTVMGSLKILQKLQRWGRIRMMKSHVRATKGVRAYP
jgi:hypothetical protein